LEPIAAVAAIAIENARLHTAVQDELAERRRIDEALRQLNEELEQRVTERTQALQAEVNERRLAEEMLRQSHEELTVLNAVSTAISQSRGLGRTLTVTLDLILEAVGPAAGYIRLLDVDTKTWSLAAQRGFPQETVQVTQTVGLPEAAIQTGWVFLISIALKFKDSVLGHIELFCRDGRELDPRQQQLLRAIARQLAVAVQNDRLAREAAEARVMGELDRLRSELIGNVSHELRTPLGLIKAASTTMLAEDVQFDRETQRELLRGIDEETDRLEHIVSNLLDLSRMDQRGLTLDYAATDLGSLARSLIEATQVQTLHCQLVHDFPAQPLVAEVDLKRIEQVLRNLIDNAVKYSPEGGTITVTGRPDRRGVLISVSDQGIGIPSSDLDRVFERFYRVEDETAIEASGVGLGLAISREIVEAHEGRIWVESNLGQGSTFYLTLPAETVGD
jgi:K+-sensing histidine kinase KdpD